MPRDVIPSIDPATTAVITHEIQENLLLADKAMYPGLAAHAASIGLVDRLANLFDAARSAAVGVYYLSAGDPSTGDISGAGPIVAPLEPHPGDIQLVRRHGMTAFYSTPLDMYLREAGITSVVITGVSANIGVIGTAIEAMNRGYQVVVPSDCVAGDPAEYVDQVLRYTLRNVALVTPAQPIIDHWTALSANSTSTG